MALSATSRTKRRCSCAKRFRGSSPAQSMNVLAQTQFCLYLLDAASCTETTSTNSIQIGRMQIRCLQILMRATPSNWSCSWTKVWCHNQTIKAGNAAKTAQKLNASTWSDKTNSLKQMDFPSLLSEVGTNTIWASKIKHCCTLSSERLNFVKSLLFQFCLVRSNENHIGSLLIEKRSHWFNCRLLATACLFWNETSNCIKTEHVTLAITKYITELYNNVI